MKHPFFAMAVVGALAGVFSASATTVFLSPDNERAEIAAVVPGDDNDLRSELQALRAQNDELLQRVQALEVRALHGSVRKHQVVQNSMMRGQSRELLLGPAAEVVEVRGQEMGAINLSSTGFLRALNRMPEQRESTACIST